MAQNDIDIIPVCFIRSIGFCPISPDLKKEYNKEEILLSYHFQIIKTTFGDKDIFSYSYAIVERDGKIDSIVESGVFFLNEIVKIYKLINSIRNMILNKEIQILLFKDDEPMKQEKIEEIFKKWILSSPIIN